MDKRSAIRHILIKSIDAHIPSHYYFFIGKH